MGTIFRYFIIILYVCESALASKRGWAHQSVFVKFSVGPETSSCGSINQPCNHLETAIDKSTGEVGIVGTISLISPVRISKNVIVRNNMEHSQPSTVKGEGMSNQTAFKLASGTEITIEGITFTDTGVVELGENTEVLIFNCSVTGKVGKVFRFSNRHSTLTVKNTFFTNIIGSVIDGDHGAKQKHLVITFIDSIFENISCCAVCGYSSVHPLTIIRCSFVDVGYDTYLCKPVKVSHSDSLAITNSYFTNTRQQSTYTVIEVVGVASLNITGSKFSSIFSEADPADSIRCANTGYVGIVCVSNTTTAAFHYNTFDGNRVGEWENIIILDSTTTALLHQNTFHSNLVGLHILEVIETRNVFLHNNSFNDNKVVGSIVDVSQARNSLAHHNKFYNNKIGNCIVDMCDTPSAVLHHNTFNNNRVENNFVRVYSAVKLFLHYNTLAGNTADGIVSVRGCKSISIRNCSFNNNILESYPVIYTQPYHNSPIPITTITNTYFYNNSAQELAHNIYSIGHLTLRNVAFISAHVSNSLNQIMNQVGNFSAENVLIKIQHTRVVIGNNGIFVLAQQIKKFSNVSFSCPVNFNVNLDSNYESVTKVFNSLSLKCVSCTKGTYSLENGKVKLPELKAKYNEYVKEGNVECIECPVGGKCDGGIKASPNFWGFHKSNHVSFVSCPISYCCTSEGTQCKSYNTCNKGREGLLCGRCKKGYRLNFFNDTCIKKSGKCNNSLFATYTIIYSLSITLFFAYVADITDILKRVCTHLKRKLRYFDGPKRVWIRLTNYTMCFDNNPTFIPNNQDVDVVTTNRKTKKADNQLPKLAVFHLFVFYYQLASLLHVKVEKQNSKNRLLEGVKSNVTNFVYLYFVVRAHEHVCLTTEMNVLQKTGIDLIFKFSTVANLFLFLIIWKLFMIIQNKKMISVGLHRLVPNQFIFRCNEILFQSISWLRRNLSLPLSVGVSRVQNVAQVFAEEHGEGNQCFREEESEQGFNETTDQVPQEEHVGAQGEDQTRVHDQDRETTLGCQKQVSEHDIRIQDNEQSDSQVLSHQQLLDSEQVPEFQKEKIRGEENNDNENKEGGKGEIEQGRQMDFVQHDFLPLSESDVDFEVSIDDEEDQLLDDSGTEDGKVRPLLFTIRLKLTFVKMCKTIYTPVTEICFRLVFCISINDVKNLYLFGDLVCFTWWQNIILVIVLPGLILFPLTFGMTLHLVQTKQITSTEFLAATGMPYYAIYLYFKKHLVGLPKAVYSNDDGTFANDILKRYEEVFRRHNQLISWPVVQLYRNFIIAAVKTFIIDPMYRSLAFLPIFCLFFIHDRSAKPFLNKSVNVLQTSSTVCLTMIVICNMIFSFSLYMTNIDTIPYMNTVLIVLSYVESIVYFIFPLMLPISIVWRKCTVKKKEE